MLLDFTIGVVAYLKRKKITKKKKKFKEMEASKTGKIYRASVFGC